MKDYIVDVVFATRDPAAYKLKLDGMIRYGACPRATIALTLAARARAFMAGRGYVTPQDVKSVGPDVLRHRIIVSYEAEAEEMTSEQIIETDLCRAAGAVMQSVAVRCDATLRMAIRPLTPFSRKSAASN